MMKTQIGLGVLAIPTAFDTLGIVPGVLVLTGIAAIITWSNYVIGTFKLNHPEVYSIDDVGGLLFGGIGRGVLAVVFCLCMCFETYPPQDVSLLTCVQIGYLSLGPAFSASRLG